MSVHKKIADTKYGQKGTSLLIRRMEVGEICITVVAC